MLVGIDITELSDHSTKLRLLGGRSTENLSAILARLAYGHHFEVTHIELGDLEVVGRLNATPSRVWQAVLADLGQACAHHVWGAPDRGQFRLVIDL